MLSLQWDALHLKVDTPYFELATTKNKRQAFVPLSTRLREQVFIPPNIERLKQNETGRQWKRSALLYPFPWTYASAQDRLQHFCDVTGLPYRGFHCWRHTKATRMLTHGAPIQAVSMLLGHANVTTTEKRYFHASALDFARYVDR